VLPVEAKIRLQLISIVIPAYKRPKLLVEAVRSVFIQDYRPLEVVVIDDSPDDLSERALAELEVPSDVRVEYERHATPLRQAGNVNRGFDLARGEGLVLLHDDDRLAETDAISRVVDAWDGGDAIVYGKLYRIEFDGSRNDDATRGLTADYFKTPRYAKQQLRSPYEPPLVGQFPNNGYLICSDLARRVRYRDRSDFNTDRWCDFDFGLRLAEAGVTFKFIDAFITEYRRTPGAISRSGNPTYLYPLILGLQVPPESEWARSLALTRLAPKVLSGFASQDKLAWTVSVYLSRHYSWRRRVGLGGLRDVGRVGRCAARVAMKHGLRWSKRAIPAPARGRSRVEPQGRKAAE